MNDNDILIMKFVPLFVLLRKFRKFEFGKFRKPRSRIIFVFVFRSWSSLGHDDGSSLFSWLELGQRGGHRVSGLILSGTNSVKNAVVYVGIFMDISSYYDLFMDPVYLVLNAIKFINSRTDNSRV